jgi:hypothetical protein
LITGLSSPTLLAQVCRHWRAVALDTPSLWRAIKVDIRYRPSLDARLIVLKTWLSRSKNCSLSLSLEKSYSPRFHELPHFTDTIRAHSARLESIKLIVPFDEFGYLEGPFPLLRQLTLEPSPYAKTPLAQKLFDNAPQLRKSCARRKLLSVAHGLAMVTTYQYHCWQDSHEPCSRRSAGSYRHCQPPLQPTG